MKYENLADTSLIGELTNFSKFEWNSVVVKVSVDKTTNTGTKIKIYTNFNIMKTDLEFTTTIDQTIAGIGFCTGNGSCNPAGKGIINIVWGSAYYKNVRIYDVKIPMQTLADFIMGR